MVSKLNLYFHTLRYLKPSQVFWRLWYSLYRPRLDLSTPPNARSVDGCWVKTACRRQSFDYGDNFKFLNEIGSLSEIGWDGPGPEKLWRYNQHYFDDLNAENAGDRSELHQALIKHWIDENKSERGVGWEPYPISLRITNWVKWSLSGYFLDEMCMQSLAVQARFLSQRVEWHLLGNHLFSNGKALVFVGLFFKGSEASKWLNKGLDILAQQLSEQVLSDGGNFERSPMYHAIFLEDLLDLINLAGAYPGVVDHSQIDQWRETATRMLGWLEAMCHPDGEIAFFNDAAIGVAPSPAEIKSYACRLGVFSNKLERSSGACTFRQFEESGYIRLDALNAVAFLDVAPVGPSYIPGHAHADTLSFELSLFGERIIVNSGISQYGSGAVRLYERSTEAHNTVVINGNNSSEVWSGFRVARRAYPVDLKVGLGKELVFVSCAHNGYSRLLKKIIHKRLWQLSAGNLVVQDQVIGQFESAVAYFHLHPSIKVYVINDFEYLLISSISKQEVKIVVRKGVAHLEESFFAPEFGIRLQSQRLAIQFECDEKVVVEICWGI